MDESRDGTLERIGGRNVLRYERTFSHPIERVWAALTKPEQIRMWLAEAEIDPRVGGSVTLRWLNTDSDGNTAVSFGKIREYDPPRLIEYESSNHGLLRWELSEIPGGCRLVFVDTMLPESDGYRTSVRAGWHIHLDHLVDALNGEAVDWPAWTGETRATGTGNSWAELDAHYRAAETT